MISELWLKETPESKPYLAWVAVNGFRFTREHTLWLLDHLMVVVDGTWPDRPSSGYTDNPAKVQHSISARAPFVLPEEVAGQLDERLGALGFSPERYAILEHYLNGKAWGQIALDAHITEQELEYRVNNAIKYIASGPCPRFLDCKDCAMSDGRCKREKRAGWSWQDWTQGNLRKHRKSGRLSALQMAHLTK